MGALDDLKIINELTNIEDTIIGPDDAEIDVEIDPHHWITENPGRYVLVPEDLFVTILDDWNEKYGT